MAQTTRPQTPSGVPASGGASAPPARRRSGPPAGRAPASPAAGAPPGAPARPAGPARRAQPGGPGRPRRDGRPLPVRPAAGGWRDTFSRLDREHTRERLAAVLLSAVIALCVLLVGGALVWDKVIVPRQPVARLDGRPITLQDYTDNISYRQNVLMSEYEQAQQLAMQPTPPPAPAATTSCASTPSSA